METTRQVRLVGYRFAADVTKITPEKMTFVTKKAGDDESSGRTSTLLLPTLALSVALEAGKMWKAAHDKCEQLSS